MLCDSCGNDMDDNNYYEDVCVPLTYRTGEPRNMYCSIECAINGKPLYSTAHPFTTEEEMGEHCNKIVQMFKNDSERAE